MQETLSNIIKKSKKIYQKNKDSVNLRYIRMLETMDKKSFEYASYSFSHAMQNGFYTPESPSNSALKIYKNLNNNKTYKEEGKIMTADAPQGFLENEAYTSIDLSETLKNLKSNSIDIFGLYGQEDGLFSKDQIEKMKTIIPLRNFKYLKNCSHNVFIDQQEKFITALKNWIL
jgi:proline iminopeptidase